MKKAIIGFWYGSKYCGEVIIDLINKGEVTLEDIKNARAKAIELAKFIDREVVNYIPPADFKIYRIY